VDLGAVAVVGLLVGLAGCEVEGAGDFLVEEDVAHRLENVGIEGEGEFADEAGALVGIEDFIQARSVAAGGIGDFAVLEFEADVIERGSLVNGGGVESDKALDGLFDRGGEDFAVRDIVSAAAGDGGDVLDRECEIGAGAFDFDAVGAVHEGLEGFHAGLHAGVIQGANIEEEFLEAFGAHAGLLGHRGGGPAQDAPAGFFDAIVENRLELAGEELYLGGWNVRGLGDVLTAADGDVGVHGFHARKLVFRGKIELLGRRRKGDLPGDAGLIDLDEGEGSRGAGCPDEGDGHLRGDVEGIDEDLFAGLEPGGKVDQETGKAVATRVVHLRRG